MRTTILFILMLWGSLGVGQTDEEINTLVAEANNLIDELQYAEAINAFQDIINLYIKRDSIKEDFVANLYVAIGSCHINMSNLRKAKSFFEKAEGIYILTGQTNKRRYADALGEIGIGYFYQGDFDEAINYLQRSYSIFTKNFLSFNYADSSDFSYYYYNLGNSYLGKEETDKAIPLLKKALKEDRKLGDKEYVADDLDNLGVAYQQKGQYEKALKYYDESIKLFRESVGLYNDQTAHAMNRKAECLLKMGRPNVALELLEKSLNIKLVAPNQNALEIADTYKLIGLAYSQQKLYKESLKAYNKGLRTLNYNLEEEVILFDQVTSPYDLLSIVREKINTEKLYYLQSLKKDLQPLQTTVNLALELIDFIRFSYKEKGSKINLATISKPIFEVAIETELLKYDLEKDETTFSRIFDLMEKSKNIILLENQKKSKAEAFANIPSMLLDQEADLIAQLNYHEDLLLNAKEENVLNDLNSKIFDLKKEYKSFIQNLEETYPSYYQLKYAIETISLDKVQSTFLEKDESLVEYFVGESNIYAAIITSSSIEVKKLGNLSNLASLVTELRVGISQYHLSNSSIQNSQLYNEMLEKYATNAKQLYNLLIAPLQLQEKLIIIPDGLLGYIPFDALLTEDVVDVKIPYKNYPFLIQKHQISYLNSVTVQFYNNTQENANNGKMLAFAPSFNNPIAYNDKGIRGGLGQLKYNVSESQIAVDIIGGRLLEAQAAIKENFLEYAPSYSILHLSTHGKANDQVGDASFLAFTEIPDSTDANERLFVRELYNLDLNADLVVLSACETGIGELQQGEGIVSLARGFTYAGVKSLITTLWSVDDEQTHNIITKFYQNIKKRQSKDLALRQAKLDYIQASPNIKAHPFYWAAYKPIGDMNSIQISNSKLLWMIGLIPILGISFFLFQKNRKTSLQN